MKIAVVDDDREARTQLADYARAVLTGTGGETRVLSFASGEEYLREMPEDPDLILLDIQMEGMNGMDLARQLRDRGSRVAIVFITSMVQYAVQGYQVEALDYLVKPVTEPMVAECLRRISSKLRRESENAIVLQTDQGICRIKTVDIKWIEAVNHRTAVYTDDGVYQCAATLNNLEEQLLKKGFFRCHAAFLVNLRRIDRLTQSDAWIGEQAIPVSRYRKQEFRQRLAAFWGEAL